MMQFSSLHRPAVPKPMVCGWKKRDMTDGAQRGLSLLRSRLLSARDTIKFRSREIFHLQMTIPDVLIAVATG